MLKKLALLIAGPVAFQKSLDSGCLPEDWKTAIVAPTFKKGSKAVAANSFTSILCKVLESFVTESVPDQVLSQKLLAEE